MCPLYTKILNTPSGPLYIYPETWNAGDLHKIAPKGNGVYGLQKGGYADPFKSAPPHEAEGGLVFFKNDFQKEDLQGLLGLWRIFRGDTNYLCQCRFVSTFGLKYLFQDINDDEYHNFQPQQLTQEEALFAFFEEQRDAYSGGRLDGLFGGDGDYAYESLCFGLMLENAYHKVFRVWSRAWLVTK